MRIRRFRVAWDPFLPDRFVVAGSHGGRSMELGVSLALPPGTRREYETTNTERGEDMSDELRGRTVAILATDGVEQVELEEPKKAVERAGGIVALLSVHGGEIQAMHGDIDKGDTFSVDQVVSQTSIEDYDGLILPGGTINPDRLRVDAAAVGFVRDFVGSGRPVAAICHGPWTLVEADVVRGRRLTSYPSIRRDIRNAGGDTVDEQVVVDANLVTSRNPDDLPAFCDAIIEHIARA